VLKIVISVLAVFCLRATVLSVDDEVALDLGCERCARVYLAILRRGGTSWLNQIVRDTGMTRKSVKRHLKRLLFLRLVRHEVGCVYRIAKEIDSVKRRKGGEKA